jgi:hypothetical protein
MSMPKGYKSDHGYATVSNIEGGLDYRSIAEEMTSRGYKMNHATARNIFLRAMKKLAEPLCELYDSELDVALVDVAAKDPRFQESMVELIEDIYDTSSCTGDIIIS